MTPRASAATASTVASWRTGATGGGAPTSLVPSPPMAPTEPSEPMHRIEPAEPMDSTEPADPMDSTDPTEPSDSTDPAETTEESDAADHIEATDHTEPRLVGSLEASTARTGGSPAPGAWAAVPDGDTTWATVRRMRPARARRRRPRPGASSTRGPSPPTSDPAGPRSRRPPAVRTTCNAELAMASTVPVALARSGVPAPARRGPLLPSGAMASTVPPLRKALRSKGPSLTVERALWDGGHDVVVGVDEVGRGSWAGPLSIGAVVVPRDRRIYKVRDSKMLTEPEREAMFDRVAEWCAAWSVGHASQAECDELGMSAAQRLAARRAIEGLGVTPDKVLLDGSWDFVGGGLAQTIVKGDATCLSIAAASILAKVTRDRMMRAAADSFPGYDFDRNKGYPCPRHKVALAGMGPTSIHRRSWAFMDSLPWPCVGRVHPRGAQQALFE